MTYQKIKNEVKRACVRICVTENNIERYLAVMLETGQINEKEYLEIIDMMTSIKLRIGGAPGLSS